MNILNPSTYENTASICEPSPNLPTFNEEEETEQSMSKSAVRLEWADSEHDELHIENSTCKIQLPGFPIDRPWLPEKALRIIDKTRKARISEKELISLMESIADQATIHFQLQPGKFVALTFLGQIVEVSDSRTGLLKKIQSNQTEEEIFVWRVGSKSFGGRT